MISHKTTILLIALLCSVVAAFAAPGASEQPSDGALILAHDDGTRGGELEPRYTPAPVEQPSSYNSSYIFGMTRGVAESTIHPAGKVPLFVLTVPLDLVFLPFAAIGGLFG